MNSAIQDSLSPAFSRGEGEDVNVFWGYGLFVDKPGDFVKKPMAACTGREIMTEVMGHLRIEAEATHILESSTCIPCMMPFITSQFLRRQRGDRPPRQYVRAPRKCTPHAFQLNSKI